MTPAPTLKTCMTDIGESNVDWSRGSGMFPHSLFWGFPVCFGVLCCGCGVPRNYGTNSGSGGVTGHFTQVVWQDSTKIGCGYDASSRASHVRWSAVPHCMAYLLVFFQLYLYSSYGG